MTTTVVHSRTSRRHNSTSRLPLQLLLRRLRRRTEHTRSRYTRVYLLTRFEGSDSGDLSVTAGEQIELLESISADWWRGQSLDGTRQGIVPANYISLQ